MDDRHIKWLFLPFLFAVLLLPGLEKLLFVRNWPGVSAASRAAGPNPAENEWIPAEMVTFSEEMDDSRADFARKTGEMAGASILYGACSHLSLENRKRMDAPSFFGGRSVLFFAT
jgi:hypothetical protein